MDIKVKISQSNSRKELREKVVQLFLGEEPGTGTGENSSRYNYYVECLKDGRKIFLTRPARNKLGFDFVVRVENTDFNKGIGRNRDNPSHNDIITDLEMKKESKPQSYEKFFNMIERVYICEEVDDSIIDLLSDMPGYPVDLILGVVKWLFIEQDIRYWNYSGRAMLFSGFPKA